MSEVLTLGSTVAASVRKALWSLQELSPPGSLGCSEKPLATAHARLTGHLGSWAQQRSKRAVHPPYLPGQEVLLSKVTSQAALLVRLLVC